MLSNEAGQVKGFLAQLKGAGAQTPRTLEQKREYYAKGMGMMTQAPESTTFEDDEICGMRAVWVRAEGVQNDRRVVLYYHGGGFYSGSPDTHKGLASGISGTCGVQVLLPEYRLTPEHKFPAPQEDCLNAYIWLLDNGFEPGNIILAGESAGASLALMTLLSLKEHGVPMPGGAVLLSIYGDTVNHDGESYTTRAEFDVISSLEASLEDRAYFMPEDRTDPLLSPIRQDLSGLPALFIQAADHEIVLSDSLRLAESARAYSVPVTLEVWDEMWHCFQAFWGMIPEARNAVTSIGGFVKERLG